MINHFNFKQFNETTKLMTNDGGRYAFVENGLFENIVRGHMVPEETKKSLEEAHFIDSGSREEFIEKYSNEMRCSKSYLFHATSLHIFVVTNICNYNCVYCQAQHNNQAGKGKMSRETANKMNGNRPPAKKKSVKSTKKKK